MHYTTSCNTQSSAPEDGQNNCPKHVELTGNINKPLLLHLVGCLHYFYKQISDNEIYLLIKYIKSIIWRAAKRLSYVQDAWCLKVNHEQKVSSCCSPFCVRLHKQHFISKERFPVFCLDFFFVAFVSLPMLFRCCLQDLIEVLSWEQTR